MDIAAHGSSLSSIYEFLPLPPNSPWAAIDAQFAWNWCYMSHIAETPSEGYLFRYYTHDPGGSTVPGLTGTTGSLMTFTCRFPLPGWMRTQGSCSLMINFLTADDSFRNLPRRCPAEVIPHLLDAYSHYPCRTGYLAYPSNITKSIPKDRPVRCFW